MAAVLPLSAFAVHHYGLGGLQKIANPQLTLIANPQAVEDDPNFITGDNPTPGRYVIGLVEANDDAPAPYVGPYVPDPNDPNAPATDPNAPVGSNTPRPQQQQSQVMQTTPEVFTDTPQVAADLTSQYGGTVEQAFSSVGCFSANNMTEAQARAMSHDSRVISVSEDYEMEGAGSVTQDVSDYPSNQLWGLDQIDSFYNSLNNAYTYSSDANNVHAYIIDSGINPSLPEFQAYYGTRVSLDFSSVLFEGLRDENSHGTAVASIVGGNAYGVAKNVRLHSVKVSNKYNKTNVFGVTWACDWVKHHHQNPAVVNMSLQQRTQTILFRSVTGPQDTAARRLANSGVTVVVAAGNFNTDVSECSPANVNELIVVGAANRDLFRAKFGNYHEESNYGGGVDLSAPGLDVKAAYKDGGFTRFGGTSAAAPYVAGVAARYLSSHPYANHYAVQQWLINNASHKMQHDDLKGSPDRFVYAPPSL